MVIDLFDAQQLACHILELTRPNDNKAAFDELIETLLNEIFGVNTESFIKLLDALVPLIEVSESPYTHTRFKGFANNDRWLLKIPADNI